MLHGCRSLALNVMKPVWLTTVAFSHQEFNYTQEEFRGTAKIISQSFKIGVKTVVYNGVIMGSDSGCAPPQCDIAMLYNELLKLIAPRL